MIFNLDKPIKVKMFGHVHQKSGCWHNGTVADNHVVLYCTDGEINFLLKENAYHLKVGDILLMPKGTNYKPLNGPACKYFFYNFEAETLSSTIKIPDYISIVPHSWLKTGYAYTLVDDNTSAVNTPTLIKNASYHIKNIFELANKLHPNANYTDKLLLDNSLKTLLIYMGSNNNAKLNGKLLEILDYIHSHYFNQITLSILSNKFSLSESYIARLFKNSISLKPSDYVNKIRISVSKTLLTETDYTITEIAEKVGFSDVYYFSKVFKNIVGVSPSKMRL